MFENMGWNNLFDVVIHTFQNKASETEYYAHIYKIPEKQICIKKEGLIKNIKYHNCNSFEECFMKLHNAYSYWY
ncbi:hypothetical protein [Methanococcus voltae]|uniref:hypothetical protein n=1 Tax=Methanococcus voltae TaxID=2188 RepID=UPI001AE55573|nr:hypothetical protein [Methanococcus voltae]